MDATVVHDPIAAARDLLPAWTVWGNDVVFVAVALLLSVSMTRVGAWIAFRPYRATHPQEWFEQARLAFPVRYVVSVASLAFPVLIGIWGFWLGRGLSPVPRPFLAVSTALTTVLVILNYYRHINAEISSEIVSFRAAVRSIVTRLILFMPHLVVAFTVMAAMPDHLDRKAWLLLALTAILTTFFAGGGNLIAARLFGLAHPASPRLAEITARAAARTAVSPKAVYEVDWQIVNALAFPLIKRLAFTRRAVERLTDEELDVICAHEMGHLAEPRGMHVFRIAIAVAVALFFPAIFPTLGSYGITGVVVLLVCYFSVIYLFAAVSRRMENRADAVATAGESTNAAYARALEHLYRLNLIPAVTSLKCQAHPDLYDRLVASGVQPEYPRPRPPSRRRMWATLAIMFAPIPFVPTALGVLVESLDKEPVPRTLHVALILPSNEAWCLGHLGEARDEASDFDQATVFFRAAATIDRTAWQYPANLTRTCLRANRCEDAEGALRDARARRSTAESDPDTDEWFQDMERAIEACRESQHVPKLRGAQFTLLRK